MPKRTTRRVAMLERLTIETGIKSLLASISDFELGVAIRQAQAVKKALNASSVNRNSLIAETRADIRFYANQSKKDVDAALKRELVSLIKDDLNDQMGLYSKAHKSGVINAAPAIPAAVTKNISLQTAQHLVSVRQQIDRVTLYAGRNVASVLDMAIADKLNGVSLESITRTAARLIREEGLSVTLPSGRQIHDTTAWVRQNLVTQVAQQSAENQLEVFDSLDIDEDKKWYETSSHMGARDEHAEWQGKVFESWDAFVAATDYGDVAGLAGVNCRHTFYPFIPGVSVQRFFPKPDKENEKRYEDMQRQRALESGIRKWKMQAEINKELGLPDDTPKGKISEWQARMREHVKETGLRRQPQREQV